MSRFLKFRKCVLLQCLNDDKFAIKSEDKFKKCMKNPVYCTEGLSMAFFIKQKDEVDYISDRNKDWEREVLLSTGGDDDGSPGVLIWFQGGDLGCLLSTGNQTWKVVVKGIRPEKGKWANIAFRWRPLQFKNTKEFMDQTVAGIPLEEMGGLQLFKDLQPIGHALQPQETGCQTQNQEEDCKELLDLEIDEEAKELDPTQILFGCHKTYLNGTFRSFSSGCFDEIAIWHRWLNETDIPYFFGGYSKITLPLVHSHKVN